MKDVFLSNKEYIIVKRALILNLIPQANLVKTQSSGNLNQTLEFWFHLL